MQTILPNAAHVPFLGYSLLTLKRMADRGHKYVGEKKGMILHLKNGKTLFGHYLSGTLKRMADRGHKYVGEKKGMILHLKNGKTLFGHYLSGFRHPLD